MSQGKVDKHTPYYELLEALRGGGCPICFISERSADRYLQNMLYEGVVDPTVRDHIKRARGFCRRHAWQARAEGGALGLAIMYRDVVADVLQALERARYERVPISRRLFERVDRSRPAGATEEVVAALQPAGKCPICVAQEKAEAMYLDVLLDYIGDEAVAGALREGRGLCLPHLRVALQRARSEDAFLALVSAAQGSFGKLLAELEEMIRRHDYRFIADLGPYGDAWLKALAQVSGERPAAG